MATKNISITETAYDLLKSKKKENESFSEVITRLLDKRGIMEFAGILADEGDDYMAELKKNRKSNRWNKN